MFLNKEFGYEKVLALVLCLIFVSANVAFCETTANITSIVELKQCVEKKQEVKQEVQRCPCKKIFEAKLGLTAEQVKLADKNRKEEQKRKN